ncbi:MAG: substrate-binding domain-containing protein [Bacteroidetes bacterium]|nr:substrate-binding domain-containing protein [Bacteroidota bacterium]
MKNTIVPLMLFGIFFSCGTDFNKPYSDTPTSGNVKIAGDETLEPLLDATADTFMGLYRYAKLNVTYKSESACFADLLNDSVKVILATRKLNSKEEDFFKSKQLIPLTTTVAIDALALIVNRENADTLLQLDQLKQILTGKISDWKDIHPNSTLGKLSFVFDNNGSSTVRFLSDSLMDGSMHFPDFCFAAKSNAQVIDYVEQNKNAIGVIGVNWISDRDDPKMLSFSKRIKVVWISTVKDPVYPDHYFGPFQAYMYTGDYPLKREVYMINREGRNGLGTGFVSFFAGEQGQRIVRLSGLLPSSPYTRDIKLN